MRLIKMASLAAVAVVAAMAFIGASSASAVSLCSNNETKCASPLVSGTAVNASLKANTEAVLDTNLGNVKCKVSNVEGHTNATSGSPLDGEITELTFTSCKLGETVCNVTVEHKPYLALVTSSGGGNGKLTAEEKSPNGKPQATVVCGSILKCIFGAVKTTLNVVGGNPATVNTGTGVEFEREGGSGFLCPTTSTWLAEYAVTSPNPVFVSAEP